MMYTVIMVDDTDKNLNGGDTMMKEFNRYNLSKPYICYKTTYKVVLNHIYVLDCDLEKESSHISFSARDLINCIYNFEGLH